MKKYTMKIESENAPIVELDSEAHAAYIRFSGHPVAKTIQLLTDDCVVTVDLDSAGKIVGVELIGVKEFGIQTLLEKAGISPLPKALADRAKYVFAPQQEEMAA